MRTFIGRRRLTTVSISNLSRQAFHSYSKAAKPSLHQRIACESVSISVVALMRDWNMNKCN